MVEADLALALDARGRDRSGPNRTGSSGDIPQARSYFGFCSAPLQSTRGSGFGRPRCGSESQLDSGSSRQIADRFVHWDATFTCLGARISSQRVSDDQD